MARPHRYIVSTVLVIAFATLITVAFWPRQLSPMAMTYRAPLFSMADRGEKIDLQTLTKLDAEHEVNVPISNALWLGGKSKDLAVLISGLVGTPENSLNIFMAQDFVEVGASVVILPSPTQWAFALRRMPEPDRADYDASVTALCTALAEVLKSPQAQEVFGGENPRRVYLAGLSLGARHSISLPDCFVKAIPTGEIRVFAVNPPVDLIYAGRTIDRLSAGLAANRSRGYAVGLLMRSLRPLASFVGVDTALRPLTYFPEALEELAGGSFSARMEQVQTAQVTQLDGISTRRSDFTFLDFMKLGPKTLEDFQREVRNAKLRTKNHLYVLHARDDFLIRSSDLDFLASELGGHAKILNFGGHGGLVFDPSYREMVAQVVGDP